jgi:hypothetical protein
MKTLYVIRVTGRGCDAKGGWSVGPLVFAIIVDGRQNMKTGEELAGELRSNMESACKDENPVVKTKILSRTVVTEAYKLKNKEDAE